MMKRKEFLKTMFAATGAVTLGTSLKTLSEVLPEDDVIMPVLFIGHGSPMNALEDNEFTQGWKAAVANIPKPKAILCVSAHWLTRGTFVTAMEKPKTIHDFGGFPKALFDAEYPAAGNPELAKEVSELVKATSVGLDNDWGLDHGTWSVLKPVFPDADIPVLQLSIDYYQPGAWHYELAKELAALRKKGVLIIGSGNMVHNLGMADFSQRDKGFDWAIEINEVFKKHILDGDHNPLKDYKTLGKSALLAIPTPDHYYPLLYTLGLQGKDEPVAIFNDKPVMGALTMTSLKIGY
jgi:4,5-DOPA dioxygenase extradiol